MMASWVFQAVFISMASCTMLASVWLCIHNWRAQRASRVENLGDGIRIDGLTQLPNRQAFEERLAEFQAIFERFQLNYSLVLFEIENLQCVNKHGQSVSDALLAQLGKVLQETRRATDHLSRISDRQFALLVPNSDSEQIRTVANRYRRQAEKASHDHEDKELKLLLRAGGASIETGISAEDLLELAKASLTIADSDQQPVHVFALA